MTTYERPAPSDVEAYLEQFEQNGWTVEDYDASYGKHGPVSVTVELECLRTHPEFHSDLLSIIEDINERVDDGAQIEHIVDEATSKLDTSESAVKDQLQELQDHGEVYNVGPGKLRVV